MRAAHVAEQNGAVANQSTMTWSGAIMADVVLIIGCVDTFVC